MRPVRLSPRSGVGRVEAFTWALPRWGPIGQMVANDDVAMVSAGPATVHVFAPTNTTFST